MILTIQPISIRVKVHLSNNHFYKPPASLVASQDDLTSPNPEKKTEASVGPAVKVSSRAKARNLN